MLTTSLLVLMMHTTVRREFYVMAEMNEAYCGPGFNQSSNKSLCSPCPADTHQPVDPNSTVCLICSDGYGIMKSASTNSSDCKLFCQPGYGMNEIRCEKCNQGFWNNGNMSMRFEPCHKCPEKYTTLGTGANDLSKCSICAPGSYSKGGNSCEFCSKGSYSLSAQSDECISCAIPLTTNQSGSTNASDCNGQCYFDRHFCGNNGDCGYNKATYNYECFCKELYTGTACERVKDEFYREFIAYVCGGLAAGVVIIISVALYIKCYKRRQRIRRQRERSQADILEHHRVTNYKQHEYTDFGVKNNSNAQINEYIDVINYPAGNAKNPTFTQYDMLDDQENIYDVLYNEFQHPNDSLPDVNTPNPDYLEIISNTDAISECGI
ncbi:hypothetical protein Btru_004893 [Bulinus truncatus]|nr:hypothetical protein Btru_004893 [Bulinus truncatus]